MIRRSLWATALVSLATLFHAGAASAAPTVNVFPSPGTRAALAGTQISFRGIPAGAIGSVSVVGSATGAHSGHIAAHSDGQGGSFVPDKPFAANETVTVSTGLSILGGRGGAFSFVIGNSAGTINPRAPVHVSPGADGVKHFRSRPDLQPGAVTVKKSGAQGSGDIFVAPQFGPVQNGPMLLDPTGSLIWFKPIPRDEVATDFRVQSLFGQPVLTWWQGGLNNGSGRGDDLIYDTHYRQIATVHSGNGLQGTDLHEFLLTPQGQAYILAVQPLHWPGVSKPLMDSVVQEIDIKTGLVMFEWHAIDHIPLSESFFRPTSPGHVFDPYHANSVALDPDGNLIVSMRNTWAAYKIDHQSGGVIWTLGSSRSSFKMGQGTQTAFQHDLVVQPDGTFTIFDDGAGPPRKHSHSRAIRIAINTTAMTATLVKEYSHSPSLSANYEGGAQTLPGGDLFVGWGQQPYFTEFTSSGAIDFDARFTAPTNTYRAYRFQWSGQPQTLPAIALTRGGNGISTVYASWNGAMNVSRWQVLQSHGGKNGFTPVTSAHVHGFETSIGAHSEQNYFEVQALDKSGHVLGTSKPVGNKDPRLSIFGRGAFVKGGVGGVQAGCFGSSTCHASTTISAGRTVIARTGREAIGANTGGTLYFTLSSAGRSMLARARGHQLGVHVSVRNSDGWTASASINLVGYGTSGAAPHTSLGQSSRMAILAHTVFVNTKGTGGIFVACRSADACHASTTVTVGRAVIARSGTEFVGGQDLGTVFFSLTGAGRSMLAHAHGNQLGAQLSVTEGKDTANAQVSLVRFG